MASIKTLEAFNKKVIKEIKKLGAVSTKEKFAHRYNIQTKAGQLLISLHIPESPSKLFSIFCIFEDVEKAKIILPSHQLTNLNKYSGKHNYHSTDKDYCLGELLYLLSEIL